MAQNTIRHLNHPLPTQAQIATTVKSGLFGKIKRALGEAFGSGTVPAKEQVAGKDRYIKGAPGQVSLERTLNRVTAGRTGMSAKVPGIFSDDQLVAYLNHIRATGDPSTQSTSTASAVTSKRVS